MPKNPERESEKLRKRALRYSLVARLADRRAGRQDGKSGFPALPADSEFAATPYHGVRQHHLNVFAARELLRQEEDIQPLVRRREELEGEIAGAEEEAADARTRLAAVPAVPAEAELIRRNAVESGVDDQLVRTRRQREHDRRRNPLVQAEQRAAEQTRALHVELARLQGAIVARKRLTLARIQLHHEHAQRRCRTYERHLVRRHPDGGALIPLLQLARPRLPGWIHEPDAPIAPAPPEPVAPR
ncbi:hypothetical protein [Amycolatopsis sp. WQ 127309]|uniref:hypothetical protein n=1 Tax=Amycolatopsis sp. WQ 127309 TaxID=2932773 RepID=UPI001FF2EDEC|nr:hypothetical protein [Amycolatopsis sp. WQ 127309]UOZ11337.1 hypothetical protein MUY22_24945 [Amycolatopsis sp. WQ 127309]